MPRSDPNQYDPEEDDDSPKGTATPNRRFDEFECPLCSAHNPLDEGFGNNDEVLCNYCGQEFLAQVNDEGKVRLKEL
jgi:hypothetical protein